MANCHNLFGEFNTEISLTSNKKSKMTTSKDGIRERIRKYFKENHSEYTPKFYIQGSYKMKTGIRTKDDVCDLDDGVYFFRTPDVTATTLQNWIWDAVNGYTSTSPEHRKKCIRNIFSGDYEIDIPVYYKVSGEEYQLAVKNNGWEDSDPKALIDWFNNNKDTNGKVIKAIKELKAWCDYKRNKMPSGLAMTILAINAKDKIVLNDRDDILLTDILREIKKTLTQKFECIVPVTPKDDLFADYDEIRKTNFLNNLDSFLSDAESALKEKNNLKASRLWQKHLGNRFPDGEDKNEQSNSNSATTSGAALSRPWGK
ncbi:nucleotidyltransferase domain-containing protein [Flavobacterium luteum]|uniref:Cyclic GMP-AMP synthase n=1 Tax=Flavobacterium luteum TaxID=2026654 RepID=A0A7J5AJM1_9FLAO|nr:nucleotidyltransferase [Flavobacterium luteum]KAB1157811.1 nucleotidyltransferase [Flavobacterium luteum]